MRYGVERINRNGLRAKLRRFFDDNPGEELTYADIARKFEVPIRTAQFAVMREVQAEKLERLTVIRRKTR